MKNPKTSNRAECRDGPMIRFSSFSVALKPNFISKNYELVLSPYEATEILLWALRAQIISFKLLDCVPKMDIFPRIWQI